MATGRKPMLEKIAALRDATMHALFNAPGFKKDQVVHVALNVNPADYHQAYIELYPHNAQHPLVDVLTAHPYLVIAGIPVYPNAARARL